MPRAFLPPAVPIAGLERGLIDAVERSGMTWTSIEDRALEIVVFGSRACGVAKADSDWDVLCVGTGESVRAGLVDLIWLEAEQMERME